MESINHVDAAAINGSQQQMQEHPIIMTEEEKSSAASMSSEKAMIDATDIILPDDDNRDAAIHSRHTFSSRQKTQRRNKSSSNKQQRKNNNNNSVVVVVGSTVISPLADGTNVIRQGEQPRKCHTTDSEKNSDIMKWSTIGNKKMPSAQELDKLTSLILPQPVSPECSIEEDVEDHDEPKMAMVSSSSPEAASSSVVSHQNQQQLVLANNFKTPMKTPPSPFTQLFNYYNFATNNSSSSNSSSKEHNKPISPTTSSMLQTSPFKSSGKLLDDQLQSVLQADRNMDKKIERMMLENDSDDSYMGSPMSNFNYSDSGDTDDDDNAKIQNESRDESTSTIISDAISELSDEAADITTHHLDHHLQSPDAKSDDVEFLTPKSRLVVNSRGRKTAATAYYTARNDDVVDDEFTTRREGNEEGRMYESDSESYSVRRMDVMQHHQQQQQQQRRPRSASYDAVNTSVTIERERDVTTTTHVVLEKVRRNSMSPPTEFRTTRVLWSDDAMTPMKAASLNWDFDVEKEIFSKRALLSAGKKTKSNNATEPPTPVTYQVNRRSQQQFDIDASGASTSLVPTQLYNTGSSNKKDTVSHACALQLGRISEEQCSAESVQSDSQVSLEREELLNIIHVMRIQLSQLEKEKDSLVTERDAHAKDCNEYKVEKEVLSAQVKTLEEEVQISLRVVENVKETLASKTDETDCLKQLLHKRDGDLDSLKASLLSKEGEVEELSLALKSKEGDLEARLQSAEKEHLAEVARFTAGMKQVHSEAIEKLESDLQEAHASELDCAKATLVKDFDEKLSELMANHALLVEQMRASSLEEVERVRSEAEKENLTTVDVMRSNHAQEIASITERLNVSQLQAIDELKAAHNEEVKLLQDASYVLQAQAEKLSKESDGLATQISLLKEPNEGLTKALSNQEEEQRQSQEAAREREMLSTDRFKEVEAMLQESDANLALLREDHKVLGETVANLTRSLEAKHADHEGAVQEKDAIITEMKRQQLNFHADIDSLTLANTALESKHAALLEDNALLKESHSTLNEVNATLKTSLGEVSKDLSVALAEKEELVASLGDAKSNIKTLEDRISFADSELVMKIQCIEQLIEEKKEASQRETDLSTQINRLKSNVASANEENVKTIAELDAIVCLEKEIREQLEASDEDKISLREEIAKLQSHLSEVKRDRDNLSHELENLSSLREEMFASSQSKETRISELESENRALSRVKYILQLKSDKFESLNASATSELDEGNKKMIRLREENDSVNAELGQVKLKLQIESEKTADLAAEKLDVEVRLKSAENERDDLQRKFNEAVVSCETMLLSLEDARLQIQLKSDEIESLNASSAAELDEVRKTTDVLSEENAATKSELNELHSQLEAESKKVADLVAEKSCIEDQLNATNQEREDLQRKFDEAVVSCESMLLSLEDARLQMQLKSDEIGSLHASSAAKLDEVRKATDVLREENVVTKAELNELHSQLEAENKKVANLIAEKSCIEDQLNATNQEREELQRKFDEAVVSCESMLLSLEDARLQIQLKSDEIESLNASSAAEFDEVRMTTDALREENAATKAELDHLQSEKSCIETQLHSFQKDREDLQRKFDEAVVCCESIVLSLEDARSQMQAQSCEIELRDASAAAELDEANKIIYALREEKSVVGVQFSATAIERNDLQRRLNEAIVSCESMLLSLEAARSHMQVNSAQVQDLEVQLAKKDDAYACEVSEKAEFFAHQQALAAKLAVNVLQLKMKSKNDLERNETLSAELELKNERIKYLESYLGDDAVAEQNLKLTVAKLASALIRLKSRERRALTVQQTLSDKNIEHSAELGAKTKENEGMKKGMEALTDKITMLELELDSNHIAIAELEEAVSVKDAEMKCLSDLLTGKDKALRDVTNEMQKIRSDVTNGMKRLELEHARAIKARSHLEEELEGVNIQLSIEREFASNLQSQLEQFTSEKNDIEDDMVDLQGTHLHLENHLEQVSKDRTHLRTQIEDMHDTIAALEADKDSLTMKLDEFQEQAEHFKKKIASLEADAKSNARQIDYMEFQLVSKMDESEALNKMVASQEATLKDLNDEIEAMDAKKTEAEESLSSLHSKMDVVINERDGLASQLQSAVKELESVRAEWEKMRSGEGSSPLSTPSELDSSQDIDNFAGSSGQGIRKILESSKITKEDIDYICSNMDKAKAIISEIGKERKTLKKEVKQLRADLEQAQGELKTVKKNCKVMNQQTIALRGDVNQAKSLLKEREAEKNQLASDLEAAHEAMDEIQRCSSESYSALVQKSQHEISMLKSELESKDEAIEQLHALRNDHISKFDITSDSIQSSQPSVVTSAERFKVEKGQSMFGILKGKRTKRKGKDQLSYRKKK